MTGFSQLLKGKLREAFAPAGLEPRRGPSEFLCRKALGQSILVVRYVDRGDRIEFGLELDRTGVGCNLVSAVLVWADGDLRVSSDVRPELNGRTRVRGGHDDLLVRTLEYIRSYH